MVTVVNIELSFTIKCLYLPQSFVANVSGQYFRTNAMNLPSSSCIMPILHGRISKCMETYCNVCCLNASVVRIQMLLLK